MKKEGRDRFFLAFDISDNRRRSRLVKILEKFGCRSQFSVFEFWLTPARKREFFACMEEGEFLGKREGEGILIIPIHPGSIQDISRYGTTSRIYEDPIIAVF